MGGVYVRLWSRSLRVQLLRDAWHVRLLYNLYHLSRSRGEGVDAASVEMCNVNLRSQR